ncbi:MAG: glucosamine-6-phosphate deaminase [Clostridia bacterium]|nr:glucosamine-6-phosphate deaminase [Clostridia bacterium]
MNIIVCNSYEEMSAAAGKLYVDLLQAKPNAVLGFATGSTPLGLYQFLAEQNKAGVIDFKEVTTFNLDEYYPMDPTHDQSYRYFMDKNLFNNINIDKANTFVPDGTAKDVDTVGEAYDAAIDAKGGIDLQLLGVGRNGHIGFNEPDTALVAGTHVTDLTDDTIDANARFFEKKEDVPTKAVTMGMGTIMKARQIVCIISGANKNAVIKALQNDTVTTDCPATFLKLHPNVTILCDKEAFEG